MADASASPGSPESPNSGEQSPHSNVREQDRFLPIANISRIMKKALPPNGKIAKDAKETVQECVSEFISFITSDMEWKPSGDSKGTKGGDQSAKKESAGVQAGSSTQQVSHQGSFNQGMNYIRSQQAKKS
ncbi:hypothetical protein AMTRI_Chr08g206560 [Amborella trichopoda]